MVEESKEINKHDKENLQDMKNSNQWQKKSTRTFIKNNIQRKKQPLFALWTHIYTGHRAQNYQLQMGSTDRA